MAKKIPQLPARWLDKPGPVTRGQKIEKTDVRESVVRRSARILAQYATSRFVKRSASIPSPGHLTVELKKQIAEFQEKIMTKREMRGLLGSVGSFMWITSVLTFLNEVKGQKVTEAQLKTWTLSFPSVFQYTTPKPRRRIQADNNHTDSNNQEEEVGNRHKRNTDKNVAANRPQKKNPGNRILQEIGNMQRAEQRTPPEPEMGNVVGSVREEPNLPQSAHKDQKDSISIMSFIWKFVPNPVGVMLHRFRKS